MRFPIDTFRMYPHFGTQVAGIHTIWSISRPVTSPNAIFAIETGQWVISFYSLTLATNLIATCEWTPFQGGSVAFDRFAALLAFRIWSTNRAVAHPRTHNTLQPIMVTIIECGALYAVTLIILLATYETKSNGAYVVVDIVSS